MFLEKIIKNKLYVRIGLAVLMLAATALVYFTGIRPGYEFASMRVLEYKFQDVSLDDVKKTVSEIKSPVKVARTNDGKIVFSFQNLSGENEKAIDDKIGEKYQFILEMKKYDETPVQDPIVRYKVVNIFALSLLGTLLMIFIRTRGRMSLIGVVKMIALFLLISLFEAVVFAGLAVVVSLLGIRFDFTVVEVFVLSLLYSLVIKFILFEFVVDKTKETGASISEAWAQAVKVNRKIIADIMVVSLVALLPALVGLSFLRNYLILFILTLPILGLSAYEVGTNILDVKLKK